MSNGARSDSAELRELALDLAAMKGGDGSRETGEGMAGRPTGFEERLVRLSQASTRNSQALGTMVAALVRDAEFLVLQPFSSITEGFPPLIREVSRSQGKEIELVVTGAETRIDRRILQDIKDPLVHLLRNSIDHGIEITTARLEAGKTASGRIVIAIEQKDAATVEVVVSDDGKGIEGSEIRDAMLRSGQAFPKDVGQISEEEMLEFIFLSGVTTSPAASSISGRGLGMAIVRERIERLGGSVTLRTVPGSGTSFHLLLPLTASTLRGLLVGLGDRHFVIPLASVEKVVSVGRDSILAVEDHPTISLGGRVLPFVGLDEVLGIPASAPEGEPPESMPTVVLASEGRRIAFRVDAILGEQETLVRSTGPQLVRLRNIGGAAVLGSGTVVPILNVGDLIKSAGRSLSRPMDRREPGQASIDPSVPRQRSILLVDDSITARSLLTNILGGAGYLVRTAVDGAEAFRILHEAVFDAIVSDIEMPRMDGFELTRRIRADPDLARLPVILVTALESREDLEKGVDAGANAYLVKSSFDQSNLLEIVGRYA
jgi:two-component system chemotaxis sensor kinase CheA